MTIVNTWWDIPGFLTGSSPPVASQTVQKIKNCILRAAQLGKKDTKNRAEKPDPRCSMYGIFTNICPQNHPVM